jgi:hypothetical protein
MRESRWPPALALLGLVLLPLLLPQRLTLGPPWLLQVVGGVFLVAILVVNPDRASANRLLPIGLTVLLIAAATWMTVRLVTDLVRGGPSTASGSVLLSSGALVWVNNNVLFGLLYWELDSGGPPAREQRRQPYPDLAFPQQANPRLAPPDWRPKFVDYLYLGLTNALAFSPTDVMPLARWAKATMALQSLISFLLIGLVIARAVNVLT